MEQPCLYYTTEKNEFALAHYMKVFICIELCTFKRGYVIFTTFVLLYAAAASIVS